MLSRLCPGSISKVGTASATLPGLSPNSTRPRLSLPATATNPAVAEGGCPVRHFSAAEWAAIPEGYKGRWEPSPWNLDSIARGELPAEYLGRRNVIVAGRYGTTLLTEGFHFVVDGEDKK